MNEDCFGRCGDIDHIPDSFVLHASLEHVVV